MDPQMQPADDSDTKKVTIGFDTTGHSFSFDPDPLDVDKASQKIKFKLDDTAKNAGVKLTAITFTPTQSDTEGGIPDWGDASGKTSVTLDDKDKQSASTGDLSFSYCVTVSYGGSSYESDPAILNKPVVG